MAIFLWATLTLHNIRHLREMFEGDSAAICNRNLFVLYNEEMSVCSSMHREWARTDTLIYIISISGQQVRITKDDSKHKETEHYINFDLTIKDVISSIKSEFPPSFKSCQESDFVANSRTFVESLVPFPGKLHQLLETIRNDCKYCKTQLEDWKHKGNIQHQCWQFISLFQSTCMVWYKLRHWSCHNVDFLGELFCTGSSTIQSTIHLLSFTMSLPGRERT